MRQEYYEIYSDLYDEYRFSGPEMWWPSIYMFESRRDLRTIEDTLNEAQVELGLAGRIRPDARLFLLTNLHQMVALPLERARRIRRPAEFNWKIALRDDVRTILGSANEEAKDAEISGHAVVNALSRSWQRLKLTQFEVWG